MSEQVKSVGVNATTLGERAIVRTDPDLVKDFIRALRESFGADVRLSEADIENFEELVEKIASAEVDALLKTCTKVETVMVPPESISVSMRQLLISLVNVYRVRHEKMVNEALNLVREAFGDRKNPKSRDMVRRAVRLIYYRMRVTPAALPMLALKVFSILSVNAPATCRSPLANMILGQYDIVEAGEKAKRR